METALFLAAILIAGLTCPGIMWWQRHRGREAACCVPRSTDEKSAAELAALRGRNLVLSARLAELRGETPALTGSGSDGARDG